MKFRNFTAPIVTAALAIVMLAAPAQAAMLKDGTKSCANPTPYQFVKAYTRGDVHLADAPSGDKWIYYNDSSWHTNYKQATRTGGGYWYVWAELEIGGANTYAYCGN